ncbi:hypothetical protein [Yinghuangia seranimata]|uniref:hypothetical protein n=1 Tax=Yinghuangia seranimata TaxID=408067 RepID=UPI00248B06D1|nr:hypothetical protein [Yinghuangia seranimata]MDI2125211.1 hypothetical protein [Yinghuangia seranimata]
MSATRRPGLIASFARFVVFGGGTGLLSSGALVVLSWWLAMPIANAFVTIVSTVLATELHSRFTFREGRAAKSVHLQSAGTALGAYLFTTAAMLGLDEVQPGAGVLTQQAVYLSASAAAGIVRFLALRFIMTARTRRTAPRTTVVAAPVLTRDALVVVA